MKAFIDYASACYPEYIAVSAKLSAIKAQKDDPFSKVEYMSEEAIHVLSAEPDAATRLGLRDWVMLIFFYDTGTCIQEVLNVRICDLKLGPTPKVPCLISFIGARKSIKWLSSLNKSIQKHNN